MDIKKGTLVKAWDDDISDYIVCSYGQKTEGFHDLNGGLYENAIEIPLDLEKQLDELK